MMTVPPPRLSHGDRASAAAGADVAAGGAPVIVLTYAHADEGRLWSLLSADQALACTSGTGILALCEQAAATWRGVEGRASPQLSPLAARSTRTLTTAAISTVLARQGGRRWCEFATAPPRAAETFLQLYPRSRVLCLHRSCTDVIWDALQAGPWGLSGSEYAPFTDAYPASSVAALTAYWTARTAPLVEFEQSHPDVCMRVHHEDLADNSYPAGLFAFLGMTAPHVGPAGQVSTARTTPPAAPAHREPFPADRIPVPLLAHADRLTRELGYKPLTPA
jgi:hypothetical protein